MFHAHCQMNSHSYRNSIIQDVKQEFILNFKLVSIGEKTSLINIDAYNNLRLYDISHQISTTNSIEEHS